MSKRLADLIKEELGDVIVTFSTVTKNNGLELSCCSIRRKEDLIGVNVYYNEFSTTEDVAEDIIKKYKAMPLMSNNTVEKLREIYGSKEMFLNLLRPGLVNRALNASIFDSGLAHRPFLDMEVIFYIELEEGFAKLRQEHLEHFGMSVDEAFAAAEKNTHLENIATLDMGNIFGLSIGLVVSNEHRYMGSGVMVSNDVLEKIRRQLNGDYYILPNTVHEFIAVPMELFAEDNAPDVLKGMIRDINSKEVKVQDFLSDSLYAYSGGVLKVL